MVFQKWSNVGWQVSSVEASGESGKISDFLNSHSYKFVAHSSDANALIMGTNQSDQITAQLPSDSTASGVFLGFGGNDTIDLHKLNGPTLVEAGKGADTVIGGRGSDQIRGMSGNDKLYGGVGIDNVQGGKGADRIYGQRGNDEYLNGGLGNDTVRGGAGRDHLIDNNGWNFLFGDSGNDRLSGRGVLDGGRGDDELTGRGRLVGGKGDDTLSGSGIELRDVFDFRIDGNPFANSNFTFGNDRVDRYDFDFDVPGAVTPDELWFNSQVDVTFRYNKKAETVVLTAKVELINNGTKHLTTAGTVTFEMIPEGVSAMVIAGLQDDLVFL